MKYVFGFFGTILTGALAGLLVIVFQGPIVRHFSTDRLRAEVVSAQWLPVPTREGGTSEQMNRDLGPYEAQKLAEGEPLYLVTMTITNPGTRRVENIRFQFQTIAASVVSIRQDGKFRRLSEVKAFELAPIAPGGSAKVQIWTLTDFADLFDHPTLKLLSYSSEGAVAYDVKRFRRGSYEDPVGDFIAAITPWVGGVFVCGALVMFLLAILAWGHASALIVDPLFYRLERKRYLADPKGFLPTVPNDALLKAMRKKIKDDIAEAARRKR
ncbi:MAG: hypothetical protein ACK4YQ_17090 [Phenylobacterium sp.]|uniref:hypothetical protein n=1 Tax=Phenylobacterium sp. TaxID=1871053 RepID=UPI003919F7F2